MPDPHDQVFFAILPFTAIYCGDRSQARTCRFVFHVSYREEKYLHHRTKNHSKVKAPRSVPCPRTQQANLLACFPDCPFNAERQEGKL